VNTELSEYSRRGFLKSVFGASVWVIGMPIPLARADAPLIGVVPWLRFNANGTVSALTNVSDMGQGTWAALQSVVARQLALPVEFIEIELAPVEEKYVNASTKNYATFGSMGLATASEALEPAAAAARTMLIQAAAARWSVPASECAAVNGTVLHEKTQRKFAYKSLLADAAKLPVPQKPELLSAADLPRPTDPRARARVNGSLKYGIDFHTRGMKYAVASRAPQWGAEVTRIRNAQTVSQRKGVVKLVNLKHAVYVVADTTWIAFETARALDIEWSSVQAPIDSATIRANLLKVAQGGSGRTLSNSRDRAYDPTATTKSLEAASKLVDLTFDVPYLAHMPMEPLNATVRVRRDGVDVWVSTQSQLDTRAAVARVAGFGVEQVQIHSQPVGGGFGRRLEHDWVLDATRIAMELPGVPVKVIWSRETELRAGFFRPAAAARVRIALDAAGDITALRADLANPSILEHSGVTIGGPSDFDWTATMGWFGQPYALPAYHLTWSRVDPGVPCAYWRSVGASQNHFFYECAIDVAAKESGKSPVAMRRQLLRNNPRALRFLDELVAYSRWHEPRKNGHFLGMAMASANGSISGHAVEIRVAKAGEFELIDIVALIDPGRVVDPRAVEGQLIGGTVFGLSAALEGEITFDGGRVQQSNFNDYPVLRMSQMPPIRAKAIVSGDAIGGVGEEGVPTIAPAIANALLMANGTPITRLPLSRAGWKLF
jgi:isoquinoline 1-oxidoreductase subunit beta